MIQGQHVRLRPMEDADQGFITELNADPAVRANVVGWEFPQSLHTQQRWFANHSESTTRRWMVQDADGQLVGMTGLWDIDWHERNALTGLKLGGPVDVRGRGLGRDVLKTVMAFAFYDVGLHRLYASILTDNIPSIKIFLNHAGFREEGIWRQHVWRHGGYVDLMWVGALREDFDSLPDAALYRDLIIQGRAREPRPADKEARS